jgi:23S rRNA (guanosine2251-2'-O)-methyltransferase
LGATDNVAWEYVENTLEIVQKLLKEETSVWAIEQTEKAIFLDDFSPDKNIKHAFVLGNEVRGVSQEVVNACGQALEIPQFGTKHSLNISVATGIVVWDYFTKM